MKKTNIDDLIPTLVSMIISQINLCLQRRKKGTLDTNPPNCYELAFHDYDLSLQEMFAEIKEHLESRYPMYKDVISMERNAYGGIFICLNLIRFKIYSQKILYFEQLSSTAPVSGAKFTRNFYICYKKRNIINMMNQAFLEK